MSDPRFARFKTDPRFRRIKKEKQKVVVDDRFKDVFSGDKQGKGKGKKGTCDLSTAILCCLEPSRISHPVARSVTA